MDRDSGQLPNPNENDPSSVNTGQAEVAQPPAVMQPLSQGTPPVTTDQAQTAEVPAELPAPSPVTSPATENAGVDAAAPDASWQYGRDDSALYTGHDLPPDVSWSASEFVEHPKNVGWYGTLALAAVIVAGLDYLLSRDLISVAVILFAAAIFGVYAGHKPRMQQYLLSEKGIQIGEKQYSFKSFKSFSVADEAGTANILFVPLGRFAPPLTVYVSLDMEAKVVDYLSLFLPFEQRRNDVVDGLLRRIRF